MYENVKGLMDVRNYVDKDQKRFISVCAGPGCAALGANQIVDNLRNEIKAHKLVFADESALIRSTTKQLKISQRFNDQKFLYKKTVIRHFSKRLFYTPYPHTENIKQWMWVKMLTKFKYTNFEDVLTDFIYYKVKFEKEYN